MKIKPAKPKVSAFILATVFCSAMLFFLSSKWDAPPFIVLIPALIFSAYCAKASWHND
jgi:hypothetical protein